MGVPRSYHFALWASVWECKHSLDRAGALVSFSSPEQAGHHLQLWFILCLPWWSVIREVKVLQGNHSFLQSHPMGTWRGTVEYPISFHLWWGLSDHTDTLSRVPLSRDDLWTPSTPASLLNFPFTGITSSYKTWPRIFALASVFMGMQTKC